MLQKQSIESKVANKNDGQINCYLNLVAWICATGSMLSGYATGGFIIKERISLFFSRNQRRTPIPCRRPWAYTSQ